MTIQYRCDGPDCVTMLTEDDARIALEVIEALPPPMSVDDAPDGLIGMMTVRATFGFTGTHHFHSAACLGAWAMDRSLNGDK